MTWLVIKWFLLAPVSTFMAVFARLICPILPLFANEKGWLPDWLWWFQTPGDSLDGDNHSWERNPGTDAWSTYKRRVAWLWRNAAYGFDMRICGIEVDPDVDRVIHIGDPDIGDNTGISGVCRWYASKGDTDKPLAWQFMFVWHYDLWKWHKCVRIGAGWKIWSEEPLRLEPAQYWIYFNPFK